MIRLGRKNVVEDTLKLELVHTEGLLGKDLVATLPDGDEIVLAFFDVTGVLQLTRLDDYEDKLSPFISIKNGFMEVVA